FCAHELYIIGGGHCGRALSEFAAKCDFNVTVIDDRKDCATNDLHPYATKLVCTPYAGIEQHIDFSSSPFIVIMTQGHKHDELAMRKILGKPYKYLGVIGSKKKSAIIFDRLLKDGYARDELQRVFMPIGLSIGSQTPYEVAVSILAQLLAVKAGIN
ncbi:MAG: XdhC family protein, partial [Legionellales bacterium]